MNLEIPPKSIIGLLGRSGAGKTTIATYLKDKYPTLFECLSFADELKEYAYTYLGFTYEDVYYRKPDNIRQILQGLGQLFRDKVDKNYWIYKLASKIFISSILGKEVKYVIDDVRYSNEALWVKENNGLLIKVVCPNNSNIKSEILKTHISEENVDKIFFYDYQITAEYGDLNSLFKQIEIILNAENIL